MSEAERKWREGRNWKIFPAEYVEFLGCLLLKSRSCVECESIPVFFFLTPAFFVFFFCFSCLITCRRPQKMASWTCGLAFWAAAKKLDSWRAWMTCVILLLSLALSSFFVTHIHADSLPLIHSSKHFALLVFLSNILVANFLLSSHVHACLFARVRACLLL